MIEWAGVDPENGDPLWYMDEEDENFETLVKLYEDMDEDE
jgi:hypothetical protein